MCYQHLGADRPVLKDVSFTLRAGQSLALVGPTGSGKSTLADLLLGLLQPTNGEIRIDGVVLDTDRVRAWQAGLGYVPQTVSLLDASIADNIAFGADASQIDPVRLAEATLAADLQDWANALPDGLQTQVGDGGRLVSGGERQRIALARALYRRPSFLVLDEATNALDANTQTKILDRILAPDAGYTVLIITHQEEVAARCDDRLALTLT